MTKCSLSETYKILCGILNYVQMHYIDWVSSFSPSCRVKLNAYAVGWVGIDGVKQLQLRPAVERPTAWSRWYHNIEGSHLSKSPNIVCQALAILGNLSTYLKVWLSGLFRFRNVAFYCTPTTYCRRDTTAWNVHSWYMHSPSKWAV